MRRSQLVAVLLAQLGIFARAQTSLPLSNVKLPEGFSISLYVPDAVPAARQLALSRAYNSDYPGAVIVYVGSNVQPGSVSPLLLRYSHGPPEALELVQFCDCTLQEYSMSDRLHLCKSGPSVEFMHHQVASSTTAAMPQHSHGCAGVCSCRQDWLRHQRVCRCAAERANSTKRRCLAMRTVYTWQRQGPSRDTTVQTHLLSPDRSAGFASALSVPACMLSQSQQPSATGWSPQCADVVRSAMWCDH